MKTIEDIHSSIKEKFYKRTKLEIAKGTMIDNFTNSVSAGIKEALDEIENNKNPHLFTNLKGSNIDSMGMLVGCSRREGEDDDSYLYRLIEWNTSNQASNSTAIETALIKMKYASNVDYVPFTNGVATGTAFIIPTKLDEETKELAIEETKERLQNVISKGTYVEYLIPELIPVRFVIYISINKDYENIKENIKNKIEKYVNSIAPGDSLEIGEINKIGISEQNVKYFSVSQTYIDNKEYQNLSITQKLEKKFLLDEIIWNMVVV